MQYELLKGLNQARRILEPEGHAMEDGCRRVSTLMGAAWRLLSRGRRAKENPTEVELASKLDDDVVQLLLQFQQSF